MIRNRKYTKNQKNHGNVPTLPDRRVEYVPVGCGKCRECMKQKQREWQVRLMEDIKHHKNGKFITLTFSDESINKLLYEEYEIYNRKTKQMEKVFHTIKRTNKQTGEIETIRLGSLTGYERDNQLATRAMKLFNERWRKTYGKAIRHWMVTELGHNGTQNIHLHGIIWTDEPIEAIRKHWDYGYIWPRPETKVQNYVNQATVNYIVKYLSKRDKIHKEYKGLVLTSPGIGRDYIKTEAAERNMNQLKETYTTSTGHTMALPIYWRNHLFTDEDKERLWIKKLDKEERWVDGQRIDVSKGDKIYNQAVKEARRINLELGYGMRQNENRKEYEEQRRDIMYETRVQKGYNKKKKKGDAER